MLGKMAKKGEILKFKKVEILFVEIEAFVKVLLNCDSVQEMKRKYQ